MKTEREMFVKKYREVFKVDKSLFVNDNGEFIDEFCQSVYEIWQARVPEGYVVVPVEPTYEMCSELSRHLGRYMQMHNRYCPKTLKKYFDRFIGEPPEWLSKEVSSWDSDHAFATADLPVFIYKSMIEAA